MWHQWILRGMTALLNIKNDIKICMILTFTSISLIIVMDLKQMLTAIPKSIINKQNQQWHWTICKLMSLK